MEASIEQAVNPIHTKALSSGASNSSKLPRTFIQGVHVDSYMLRKFCYSDRGIPPFYGNAEPKIELQTKQLIYKRSNPREEPESAGLHRPDEMKSRLSQHFAELADDNYSSVYYLELDPFINVLKHDSYSGIYW
ncbi:hypothetical protein T265_15794, partial [Opisthorchis viverrini]